MIASLRSWVAVALSIDIGVHAALTQQHVGVEPATAVLFAAATLAPLVCLVLFLRRHWIALPVAAGVLAGTAILYVISRLVTLPIVGVEPFDLLGIVTSASETIGAIAAVASLSERRPSRAPIVVCALIATYAFLLGFALPSAHNAHHHDHHHAHPA
jgi:hypothetical protein